jgi:ubiquinol-cytochrome c reductase cytochrome c subunit
MIGSGRLPGWLAATALVAVAITITALHGPGSAAAAPTAPAAPAGSADPRAIYQSDCAVCHGSDGRGTNRGPTLIDVGRASTDYELSTGRMPLAAVGRSDSRPDAPLQVLPNVELGDPNQIPQRHDPAYSTATIGALVDYVAQLAGDGGPDIPAIGPGNVADGGESFRLQCAACHAWAGDGGALLNREAPALHSATRTQIAEAVRVGPGQMPSFGSAALSDDQLVSEGGLALIALAALLIFVLWIGERG